VNRRHEAEDRERTAFHGTGTLGGSLSPPLRQRPAAAETACFSLLQNGREDMATQPSPLFFWNVSPREVLEDAHTRDARLNRQMMKGHRQRRCILRAQHRQLEGHSMQTQGKGQENEEMGTAHEANSRRAVV